MRPSYDLIKCRTSAAMTPPSHTYPVRKDLHLFSPREVSLRHCNGCQALGALSSQLNKPNDVPGLFWPDREGASIVQSERKEVVELTVGWRRRDICQR